MPEAKPATKRTSRALVLAAIVVGALAILLLAVYVWRQRQMSAIREQLAQNNAAAALELATAHLTSKPGDQRVQALKARALVELKRWDEACEIFARVGTRSAEETQAWATALAQRRRWDEAASLWSQVVQEDPQDASAWRQLTTCQFEAGQLADSLASAEKLAALPGRQAEGLFLSGVVLRQQGNTELAVEQWTRVAAIRPTGKDLPVDASEFFLVFGEDLLAIDRPRAALVQLTKSCELQKTRAVQLRLAAAWAMLGEDAKAEALWKELLGNAAGDADWGSQDAFGQEARRSLAETALRRAEPGEALEWLAPLAESPRVSSATAYLMERSYTLLGDEEQLALWQRRTFELRESERQQAALKRRLRE